MQAFIKVLKIIAGIVLGLIFSFLTIVGLDAILQPGNPFGKTTLNLWWIAPIVAGWLLVILWILLRKPSVKKIHTPGIENLPLSISEFIDEVINAMKYRRSARAEVRQELTDHFTDALAHCEDEQEKQQRVKELIEEFGDVKLLGTLLRRAKKRCRPLWRTVVARTFQFLGICVLLLGLYIGWFFTGKPQIATNYLEVMNRQVRPAADESQNAWPFYKQAAEKRVQNEDKKDKKINFSPRSPQALSQEDRQIIQQSIRDNQESLNLIRQGNQKPHYWQVYGTGENEDKEMLSMLMPHLSDWRDLSRLMCWQGLFHAEQGDFEKAFDDIMEAYSFGHHLRGQNTTLIEQLVAMAIENMSTDTLRKTVARYGEQIGAPLLDSTRKQFAAVIKNKDFTIDFESEKLFMYDEAQRSFTRSRFGKSHLYLKRFSNDIYGFDDNEKLIFLFAQHSFKILFTHPNKEQTLKEADRLYSEMQKIAAMTPASAKSQGLDINATVEESIKDNVFLRILMPALGKVNQIAWRYRAETQATLGILSVMQYQKEYGQFPESLEVLVETGLLKDVPMDPFSDKPLVYRKTDDGFMLYSVGLNFIDDGGVPGEYSGTNKNPQAQRWTDTGDAIFWPVDSVNSQQ